MKMFNLINATQAHQVIQKIWHELKPELVAGNKQVIIVKSFEESMTAQQRKYYHSAILEEIAKQAIVRGVKYDMKVWKNYFREMYLGDKVVDEINPISGAVTKKLVRVSSESLSVKGYNELIEKVCAYAINELNVNFHISFDDWIENEENVL
jgi:hypothetical protein